MTYSSLFASLVYVPLILKVETHLRCQKVIFLRMKASAPVWDFSRDIFEYLIRNWFCFVISFNLLLFLVYYYIIYNPTFCVDSKNIW